eukprot:PITA_24085
MDVKTSFLHGDLEEEIYMKQLEGFVVKGKKELVCKLKKSLYGLKQSPRMWYKKFDTFIRGHNFTRRRAYQCVYFKSIGDLVTYLVLYVDDMLLVRNEKEIIEDLKTQLSSKFDMKDLVAANYILGMEIKRDRTKRKFWLNQRKHVETILHRFNMHNSKPVKVHIPIGVRPDIAHAVGVLSRFMSKLGKEHWKIVKQVFRYLRGPSDYGLFYQGKPGLEGVLDIHGFVDVDWARDLDQRRSTSGYVFNLFGGAVSWISKKQYVVPLSTTEVEYIVATHASEEAVWL